MRTSLIAVALLFCLVACSDDIVTDEGTDGLTWSAVTRQIAADNCVPCHVEGGAAPFALDSHAQWEIYGSRAISAIDRGVMPPWMPDPDCLT